MSSETKFAVIKKIKYIMSIFSENYSVTFFLFGFYYFAITLLGAVILTTFLLD